MEYLIRQKRILFKQSFLVNKKISNFSSYIFYTTRKSMGTNIKSNTSKNPLYIIKNPNKSTYVKIVAVPMMINATRTFMFIIKLLSLSSLAISLYHFNRIRKNKIKFHKEKELSSKFEDIFNQDNEQLKLNKIKKKDLMKKYYEYFKVLSFFLFAILFNSMVKNIVSTAFYNPDDNFILFRKERFFHGYKDTIEFVNDLKRSDNNSFQTFSTIYNSSTMKYYCVCVEYQTLYEVDLKTKKICINSLIPDREYELRMNKAGKNVDKNTLNAMLSNKNSFLQPNSLNRKIIIAYIILLYISTWPS